MDTLNDIISGLKFGDLDPVEAHDRVLALFSVSPSLPTDEAFRAAQDEICFYGMAGRENQSKRAIMEVGFEAGYRYAQHRLKVNEG